MPRHLLVVAVLAVLAAVNWGIWQREQLIAPQLRSDAEVAS